MAQLGYFHCLRTFSKCCNSLYNNPSSTVNWMAVPTVLI